MCCFTGPVKDVSATRIFARSLPGRRQLVVYEAALDADAPVAMVLPIPVAPGTKEADVRFVDLSGCPKFFDELAALWPEPKRRGGGFLAPAAISVVKRLTVHKVGRFVASFAPTRADLSRLDPRFQLPAAVWDQLPEHAASGFAVFQLEGTGKRGLHPMAFEFPRADDRLFFPTVHVHDGQVHERAAFDHVLFAQPDASWVPHLHGFRSPEPLSELSQKARAFVGDGPIFRDLMSATLPNRDVWLDGQVLAGRSRVTAHVHVRVITAWEMLQGQGRGAPRDGKGLDPTVWKELQVSEATRAAVCARVSARLEAELARRATELGVRAWDETLPATFPEANFPGAVPMQEPCKVSFNEQGGGVFATEARVAFDTQPTPAACAAIRAALRAARDEAPGASA